MHLHEVWGWVSKLLCPNEIAQGQREGPEWQKTFSQQVKKNCLKKRKELNWSL